MLCKELMRFQAPLPQLKLIGSLFPRIVNGKGAGNLAFNIPYKPKAFGKILRK